MWRHLFYLFLYFIPQFSHSLTLVLICHVSLVFLYQETKSPIPSGETWLHMCGVPLGSSSLPTIFKYCSHFSPSYIPALHNLLLPSLAATLGFYMVSALSYCKVSYQCSIYFTSSKFFTYRWWLPYFVFINFCLFEYLFIIA